MAWDRWGDGATTLPVNGATAIELSGAGTVGGTDGWQFDFTLTADVE